MAKIRAVIRGTAYEYNCDGHTTLLEQALDQGIDLPFGCMAGACTACKAKLVKGKVEMEEHSSLEDEEVEEGWILTCQAFPQADFIHIVIK